MKKIFSVLFLMLSIICLVYLYNYTDVLDFGKCEGLTAEQKVQYEGGWYYNKLDFIEKEIYVNYAHGVESLKDTIRVKIKTSANVSQIKAATKKAIEAYKYDYPKAFYVEAQYSLATVDLGQSMFVSITPKYSEKNMNDVKKKQEALDTEIAKIRALLKKGMSDYQKELIIHDYIAKYVSYPEVNNIEDIPNEMHTAYNALVKGEAVCDGISRAFQIIMDEENIESIFTIGDLEGESHAWNIINLEGSYYHVDVTSDKIDFKKENETGNEGVIHAYLNITDEEIKDKHKISKEYGYPECNATKYNYYYMQNSIITQSENTGYKVVKIDNKNTNAELLEFRVLNNYDASESLVQTLYNNDFNKYRTNRITSIGYSKIRDIYVFKKN